MRAIAHNCTQGSSTLRIEFTARRICDACILDYSNQGGITMTLCPIAIVAGCKKCPAFSVCPLKSVIGDAPKVDDTKKKKK
jgi:hypothetical protein